MVCPPGGEEAVRWKLQEFWDSMEFVRVLFSRGDAWEATFTVALKGMLEPRERLSLPGAADAVVWLGGDATLETCFAVDWTNSHYVLFEAEPFGAALGEAAASQEPDLIIALCELLCLVALPALAYLCSCT